MPKIDVFMPLYIGDYLRDTPELDAELSGAYLHILMYYWIKGAPPDHDGVLARIARCQPDRWQICRPVLEEFFLIKDGKWTHQRVEDEIQKATSRSNASRLNGKKGGRPRKQSGVKKQPENCPQAEHLDRYERLPYDPSEEL